MIKIANRMGTRVKVKQENALNLLFDVRLSEWKAEAERQDPPSDRRHTYGMALKSLRAYPLPLTSATETTILKGFKNNYLHKFGYR